MRKKKHGFRRPVVIKKPKQPLEQPSVDPITGKKIPKSFVFSRGKLPGPLRQLQMDLRKLMLPYTALSLREKKRNNLRDFLNVAGPMGVTHFLILSKTATAPYLRVATTPQGPTLTFKIHEYSLAADIARSQLHPRCPKDLFKNSALIVLSGFVSRDLHLQLTTNMFQNIFPTIDVKTVKLSSCQRIVLLNYNKDTKFIDFRHYSIRLQPVGVSRRISKLVQSHQVPDLKNLQDVAVERKTHLLNYNKDTKFIDFRHYSIRLQPVGVSRRISKLVQSHQVPDLKNLQDVAVERKTHLLNYNKDTKFIDFRHYSIRLQPVGVSRRISKLVQSHQVPDLKNLQDVAVERKTHLLNYNKDTKFIDFRHYSIRLQPVGVSRRISKLVQSHQVPDLKNLQDVSDFVTKAGYGSESEADEEAATVTLSSNLGRVNRASTKSAVKLQEIGPRMTLQLVKVEKGLCSGEVLFSEYGKAGDKGKSDDEMQDNEDGEDSEGSEDEDEDEGGEDPEDGEDDEELD